MNVLPQVSFAVGIPPPRQAITGLAKFGREVTKVGGDITKGEVGGEGL